MTVAILRDSGDIIWMDAVVNFQQSYTSSVSKHPIESGGVVTDHVTEANPTMRISGVVSGVDFSAQKPIISALETEEYGIDRLVNTEEIGFITVNGTKLTGALRFLPESLSQFLGGDTAPEVTVQAQRVIDSDPINTVRQALIELNRGVRKVITGRVINIKETFTILEVTPGGKIIQAYPNCVLTGVSFSEDANSGYALYPDLTIERVRFVDLVTTKLPEAVSNAVKKAAAKSAAKGKQASKGTGTSTTDVSAKNSPTSHGKAPPPLESTAYKKMYKIAEGE